MKYKSLCGLASLIGILAAAVFLPSAVLADSSTVTYQGTLRQPTHIPIGDGDYAMTFSLWDAETAGNSLWTESHAAVPVREGLFSVQLGSNTAFGALFADHADVWMEVTVDTGSGPEVYGPRMPFASVPYALHAAHAAAADTADSATHAATADSATNATHAAAADSATTATNATNAGDAARLNGQIPAFYAPASHTHNASAIVSGTLSTDRYSAYSDLSAESKIGTGSTQVAAGNHNHASLPWFWGWAGGETSGTKTISTGGAGGVPSIGNTGTALVAPVAGFYLVHYRQLYATYVSGFPAIYVHMLHNGGTLCYAYVPGNHMHDAIIERLVWMNAGDTISFVVTSGPASNSWGGAGSPHTTISMHLVG